MLTIVPHNHRYWLEEGGRWEFFWISMSGQEAVRIHRVIQAAAGPVFRTAARNVERLAGCCLRLIEGEGETPGAASAIAYEAAMVLYDEIFRPHSAVAPDGEDNAIRPVLEHIRANLDKPISVSDLAEIAGCSRAHFSRMFTASEGVPPAELVLQERMRRAARLLDQPLASAGQGDRHALRIRGAELFRQGVPPLLRRQPDRVPHDGNVCRDRRGALREDRADNCGDLLGEARVDWR